MTPPASAAAMARDLAADRSTALGLAEAALARIEAVNPAGHIFISVTAASALAEAKASDKRRARGATLGALDGIPTAVKDNIDMAGVATTAGIGAFRDRLARQDATVVRKLRAGGAVLLGKLNMHEGALGATTDNAAFGRCDNPRVPGHTPGGSSGGSAAAVAAGIAPIAIGTDTMGSVRIPAAYCGLWGLKPTRGLVGASGLFHLSWTLDAIGPLATSPEDLAVCLRLMAGVDEQDPAGIPAPAGWDPALPDIAPGTTVLGVPTAIDGVALEPAVRSSFDRCLEQARAHGSRIVPLAMAGWSPSEARRAGLLVCEAECANLIGPTLDTFKDGVSPEFRSLLVYGRQVEGERLAVAYWKIGQIALVARQALTQVDAILMPTSPQRAFPHGTPAPATQADFTALASLAGLPAVAFPLPSPASEPPCSAQLVGRPYAEGWLLSMAKALSETDDA